MKPTLKAGIFLAGIGALFACSVFEIQTLKAGIIPPEKTIRPPLARSSTKGSEKANQLLETFNGMVRDKKSKEEIKTFFATSLPKVEGSPSDELLTNLTDVVQDLFKSDTVSGVAIRVELMGDLKKYGSPALKEYVSILQRFTSIGYNSSIKPIEIAEVIERINQFEQKYHEFHQIEKLNTLRTNYTDFYFTFIPYIHINLKTENDATLLANNEIELKQYLTVTKKYAELAKDSNFGKLCQELSNIVVPFENNTMTAKQLTTSPEMKAFYDKHFPESNYLSTR